MRRLLLRPGPLVSALLAVVVCGVSAGDAVAQRACQIVEPTGNITGVTIGGLGQVFYISRPSFRCADGVYITADSAVAYPSQSRTELMGNVRFRDAFRELTSDQARYFTQQGRLQASGHLVVVDTARDSRIEDGAMVLLRQTEFRAEEEMTVTRDVDGIRPRARLYLQPAPDTATSASDPTTDTLDAATDTLSLADDSVAVVPDSSVVRTDTTLAADSLIVATDSVVPDSIPPPETPEEEAPAVFTPAPAEPDTVPYLVEADRLFLQGERVFQANGRVEITRDSLKAYADSTRYDQMAGLILLQGSARVDGEGYDLTGRDIDLGVPDGAIRSVRATREAVLTGDRLRLDAPVIELFLTDGAMDRLVATPMRPLPGATEPLDDAERARPVAVAEEFTLTADSIEVVAPGEALDHITAVGGARGVSSARDSLNVEGLPEIARNDWLEGDTVVATFIQLDSAGAVADTASGARYQLDRLVASGTARSLYRLESSDSAAVAGTDAPAVHYVTGAVIVIVLASGQVERMEVDGPTHGWHLEPRRPGRPADTLIVPDSAGTPPDTVLAAPPRARASQPKGGTPPRSGSEPTPARPGRGPEPLFPARRRARR